jgi:hypothetical protein
MNLAFDLEVEGKFPISRSWSMPSPDTLSIEPIANMFFKYSQGITVDPFARNCELCHITNDLNPATSAMYHEKADMFLSKIEVMNFVIFDPPYSLTQVKKCYESIGVDFLHEDTQNCIRWSTERDIIACKQSSGDRVLSLGWSSTCMTKSRGYKVLEIVICTHGSGHNDTICVVEEKL